MAHFGGLSVKNFSYVESSTAVNEQGSASLICASTMNAAAIRIQKRKPALADEDGYIWSISTTPVLSSAATYRSHQERVSVRANSSSSKTTSKPNIDLVELIRQMNSPKRLRPDISSGRLHYRSNACHQGFSHSISGCIRRDCSLVMNLLRFFRLVVLPCRLTIPLTHPLTSTVSIWETPPVINTLADEISAINTIQPDVSVRDTLGKPDTRISDMPGKRDMLLAPSSD